MKVLMVNGGTRQDGCTFTALKAIGETLVKEGIDYEIFHIGSEPIRDCIGCRACAREKKCVFTENNDAVNVFIEKAKEADGFVFGSPVYFAHPTGRILSFLDRAFYSNYSDTSVLAFKPAAAIVSARRGGTTASVDVLNKYFTIRQMPVVSSTYWNMVHGNTPEEVLRDAEGIQTMRNIGHNMAWLLKCIEAGKKAGIPMPETQRGAMTNFIK